MANKATVTVRAAGPKDEAAWRRLWADYLTFYELTLDPAITDATWAKAMSDGSAIFMRVAELDGEVVGFTMSLTHEGTWITSLDCYLEDLFVDETARGRGVGRALLDDLVTLCRQNGWSRLYWHTAEDNAAARRLYDSYVETDNHIRYRIEF
ncbi:N-acetyltransferase [Pseudorhizobium endolithicum]|uniref:N-acetyltransferase n=1 Tax=Pseudorhizobium endolithicum TaxID=1191678 RepID=A0ABN7JW79_9HYPH|nr:GNAT family N-acetyltransferase [Pseudorhizobium endolithicum]CAD6427400.1 N-acetyltransferase [Rhizobium sp. Q54]CAD7051444.1 N-acetyltransferase [Pseudorhizobium endolithicum]